MLLVGRLDRLLGSRLVVGLLSSWLLLLLLVGGGRPLLLSLQYVAENVAFSYVYADNAAAAEVVAAVAEAAGAYDAGVSPAGSSGSDSAEEQLLQAWPLASAFSQSPPAKKTGELSPTAI